MGGLERDVPVSLQGIAIASRYSKNMPFLAFHDLGLLTSEPQALTPLSSSPAQALLQTRWPLSAALS